MDHLLESKDLVHLPNISKSVQMDMIKRMMTMVSQQDIDESHLVNATGAEETLRLLFGNKRETVEGRQLQEVFETFILHNNEHGSSQTLLNYARELFTNRRSSTNGNVLGVTSINQSQKDDAMKFNIWRKDLIKNAEKLNITTDKNVLNGLSFQSLGLIIRKLKDINPNYSQRDLASLVTFSGLESPIWKDFGRILNGLSLLKRLNTAAVTTILRQSLFKEQGVTFDPIDPNKRSFFYKQVYPFGLYHMNAPDQNNAQDEESKTAESATSVFTDPLMNMLVGYLHAIYRNTISRNPNSHIKDAKVVMNIVRSSVTNTDRYFNVTMNIAGSDIKKLFTNRTHGPDDINKNHVNNLRTALAASFEQWRAGMTQLVTEQYNEDDENDFYSDININSMTIFRDLTENDVEDVHDMYGDDFKTVRDDDTVDDNRTVADDEEDNNFDGLDFEDIEEVFGATMTTLTITLIAEEFAVQVDNLDQNFLNSTAHIQIVAYVFLSASSL
jgi:hypothetical protein